MTLYENKQVIYEQATQKDKFHKCNKYKSMTP